LSEIGPERIAVCYQRLCQGLSVRIRNLKMNILHMIPSLAASQGGPSVVLPQLARWQAYLGAQVHIVTRREDEPTFDLRGTYAAGVRIHRVSSFGPKILGFIPRPAAQMQRYIEDAELVIIHGGVYQHFSYAAASVCRAVKKPYIFVPHGGLDPAVRRRHPIRNRILDVAYNDRTIQGAVGWHFTSETERKNCERQIWKSSFVAPWGLDINEFNTSTAWGTFRKAYGIPEKAKLFLFLSRLTKKKGIDILLRAFRELAEENDDVYLALCGPVDEDLSELVASARRDEMTGRRLIVTGMLLNDLKEAAFKDADFFVLPTYSENFGVAVFEAVARGCPTITTTGMDLHSKLAECDRIKIISPTLSDLSLAMSNAYRGNWTPTTSADNARLWIDQNFSWRKQAATILEHYQTYVK
jgi:glycosyltransferase involved in cell wall biosynthesis